MKRIQFLLCITSFIFIISCDSSENDHPHYTGQGHVHDEVVSSALTGGEVQPLFGKLVLPKQENDHTKFSVVTFVNPKRLKFKASDGHTKDQTHRHVKYQVVELPLYDSLGSVKQTVYVYELLGFK